LLRHVEEFGRYVEITGFCNVKIGNVEEFFKSVRNEKVPNVEVQFFDANLVASWQHLYFAALNALTAFKNKQNLSKSLAMESMLYASARRQIQKATETLGIKPNTSEVAMLIIGEKPETVKESLRMISANLKAQHDEKVLELSKKKVALIRKAFDISDLEIETIMKKDDLEKALTDLVLERMALLASQR